MFDIRGEGISGLGSASRQSVEYDFLLHFGTPKLPKSFHQGVYLKERRETPYDFEAYSSVKPAVEALRPQSDVGRIAGKSPF